MEIVERMAQEKRVEQIVRNIAHRQLEGDLLDLCQMIYVILLTYDEAKIVDLWESGAINFFVVRVALTQYRSNRSDYHKLFRRPSRHEQLPEE